MTSVRPAWSDCIYSQGTVWKAVVPVLSSPVASQLKRDPALAGDQLFPAGRGEQNHVCPCGCEAPHCVGAPARGHLPSQQHNSRGPRPRQPPVLVLGANLQLRQIAFFLLSPCGLPLSTSVLRKAKHKSCHPVVEAASLLLSGLSLAIVSGCRTLFQPARVPGCAWC